MANRIVVPKRVKPTWTSTPTGILVPAGARAGMGDNPFFRHIRVGLGYEMLTGTSATWSDVEDRLKRYTLGEVLVLLSRLTAALRRHDPEATLQRHVARGWLGHHAARAIELMTAGRKGGERYLLFGELQALNLAKAAFRALPVADTGPPHDVDLTALGEALLMVTDLMVGPYEAGHLRDPDDENASWAQSLLANGLFHASEFEAHALARCHDLYLTPHEHLAGRRSYLDLPQLVGRATGLPPEALWAALFALYSNQATKDGTGPEPWPAPVEQSTYFASNFKFTAEELNAIWAFMVEDADSMKAKVIERYATDIHAYDFFPFECRPLIRIGSRLFCPSASLLFDRVARGLHHVVLGSSVVTPAEKDKYQSFMGDVFADYVDKLFLRCFPNRYVRLDDLGLDETRGVADGLIDYGDALVVVETKKTQFKYDGAVGRDMVDLKKKLGDIFVDGARQIRDTIHRVRAGELRRHGIAPDRIRCYHPLIVTLERMPMNPFMYDGVVAMIRRAGIDFGSDVAPLQVSDVDDLEFMEVALDHVSLRDVLDSKNKSAGTVWQQMGNFCLDMNVPGFVDGRNKYLGQRFEEVVEAALGFFRARSRGSQP